MRGNKVDLQEIILQEVPENVDLHCAEVLQEEEEVEVEEEQQVHEEIIREPYEVSIRCGVCDKPIRCVCLASISAIRELQQLLFGPLQFVCVPCVNDQKLNHGG